jgi:hypothetical protein
MAKNARSKGSPLFLHKNGPWAKKGEGQASLIWEGPGQCFKALG